MNDLKTIGWREWVALPDLAGARIKAKIDTGARTSALHAFGIRRYKSQGMEMVDFKIHPLQRDNALVVEAEAELLEERAIRSSNGQVTRRPVVVVEARLMGETWPIEVTLVSRDEMGFRMLLGREAMRGRFVVDSGRSFLGGRAARKKKTKKKARAKKKGGSA